MSLKSYIQKKREFNKIARDIKKIRIQGARDVARWALYAYFLIPTKSSKKKLLSLRPTEPMLHRVLEEADKTYYQKILEHFDLAQDKINASVLKLIKNGDVIFTHCHSTNVVNALIYTKKKKRKFEVFNTETRPLFQGRRTALELTKEKIPVTMFIDSALALALSKKDENNKNLVKAVFLGADALMKEGVINKIGSKLIAEVANDYKIPVYVIADSWKFSNKPIPIEQRNLNEVWDKAPKKVKIINPAFEFVPKRYIHKVVSEFGILDYKEFLGKMRKN